jgi:plasmid stabilization system protein ParE
MPDFLLTVGAEADLNDIAIYTVDTWGVEQARKYDNALTHHFGELSDGTIRTKAALPARDDVRVSRCEHHYVFSVKRRGATVILAVLHERMDLLARFRARLESEASHTIEEPGGDD